MGNVHWLQRIALRDSGKVEIAEYVVRNPARIPEVISGLGAPEARLRYGCAKVLRLISLNHPQDLYPYIDRFVALLDNENRIMRWEGIHVLGNLAAVDSGRTIDKILNTYLAPIRESVLITAANTITGAGKIASTKPHLAQRIASALLDVEKTVYETAECRNIALGHVISSFDLFFDQLEDREEVIALIKRQLTNRRNSTRKKAERFIKKRRL